MARNRQIIKEKVHAIPLKAKEAAIYGVNLFPKKKSTFQMPKKIFGNLKPENNRIGRHGSDS